jgi:hypothetical protein
MRFTPWKVCTPLVCLVLGLLALGSTMSSAQAPKQTPVVAWEYKTIFGSDSVPNDPEMNNLGNEGWELLTVIEQKQQNPDVRFVFKRAKRVLGGAKAEGGK